MERERGQVCVQRNQQQTTTRWRPERAKRKTDKQKSNEQNHVRRQDRVLFTAMPRSQSETTHTHTLTEVVAHWSAVPNGRRGATKKETARISIETRDQGGIGE